MIDDILEAMRGVVIGPYPVAVWCIDRPDLVNWLLHHRVLGHHLRDDTGLRLLSDDRLPLRTWNTKDMAMDGKPRWMNWMPPGVYVEMSSGLPVIVRGLPA